MSFDYRLAESILSKGGKRAKKSPYAAAWYEAVCEVKNPLTFTAVDGNIVARQGDNLTLTEIAAQRDWRTGERAAAILSGGGLLIIDRI